ncbi:hypothetical protein D9M69_599510 [compost metagenome]
MHGAVVQQDHVGAGRVVHVGLRQVALAVQQRAVAVEQLVVDVAGVVGTQDLARRLRQHEVRLPLLHRDQLGQHLHVVLQRAVEGRVGDALRHQPGHADAHRHEQQQRREHPVEDLAEQGALGALEELQGSSWQDERTRASVN